MANDFNVEKEANDVGVIVEEETAEIVEEAPAYMGQFIDANLVTSSQPYFGRSPEILWAMDLADIGVAEKMAPGSGVLARGCKERAKVLEVPQGSGDLARQIQHIVDEVTAVVPEDVVVPPEIQRGDHIP